MSFSIRTARCRTGRKRAGAWSTNLRRFSSPRYAWGFAGTMAYRRTMPNTPGCTSSSCTATSDLTDAAPGLQSCADHQNEQHDEHQTQSAAREVAPIAAVAPRGQRTRRAARSNLRVPMKCIERRAARGAEQVGPRQYDVQRHVA